MGACFSPLRLFVLAAMWIVLAAPAHGEGARVAVAANFRATAEALEAEFEGETGHDITLVSGATGQLYAQIRHGAPYHAFLAADQARPDRLVARGRAPSASRFTYAIGRLAVWSDDPARVAGLGSLRPKRGEWVAIADPDLAPYGAAAVETLHAAGLYEAVAARLTHSANVNQAYTLIASGAAGIGIVSAALVEARPGEGSSVPVPADLHAPICQDAVLLDPDNAAARAFLAYLRSPPARAIIVSHGYALP